MGRDDTLYLSCSRSSSFILSPNDTSCRVRLANFARSMTGSFKFIFYFLIFSFVSIERKIVLKYRFETVSKT